MVVNDTVVVQTISVEPNLNKLAADRDANPHVIKNQRTKYKYSYLR
jgi:hypothetical protein